MGQHGGWREADSCWRRGWENGSLGPVAGKQLPLADAPLGQQEILEPGAYGKIVLVP
jgi:NADPH:quinone reductase